MKAISFCDGIGTGYHALKKAGFFNFEYDAVEIDEKARKTADLNCYGLQRPCDDVLYFNPSKHYDLFLCGFTCSSLTSQGRRQGLDGASKIIFTCMAKLNFLREVNPNIKFLIENVASMSNKDRDALDKIIGCEHIKINSADFSGQARVRYYWTNIKILPYEKSNISALSYLYKDALALKAWSKSTRYVDQCGKVHSKPHASRVPRIEERFRADNKANTLVTGEGCTGPSTKNIVKIRGGETRLLRVGEAKRLQGLPSSFCFPQSDAVAYKQIGLGWQMDTIAHILRGLKK